MKSCPQCQQVYTDEGPEFCLNDGTPLVRTPSEYNPGAAYGSGWQQPTQAWQPPPQPWGYQPPQYPPFGSGPGVARGGEGLSRAALITGLGSIATFLMVFLIVGTSGASRDAKAFAGIIFILSIIAGLTAIILGIVSISMANRNPAAGKAKGIIGICLGALPLIFLFIALIAAGRRF
jgi:hypothetical protein